MIPGRLQQLAASSALRADAPSLPPKSSGDFASETGMFEFELSRYDRGAWTVCDAYELPDGRLALGSSNNLLIFDLQTCSIVDRIELSSDPLNSVFDIQFLPPEFDLPPDSLEDKVGKIVGFDGCKVLWESGAAPVAP